ncbi:hypothetical protein EVAR_60970_1 [Eumeta japonica]|uniref:Uncharacterized protein n=1 Tax=Eumeta variegata TaxID=151549 RepID=A0A4C1XV31_EUMVA|nr:hypothetical protein EVAR_60970_1 [Eumeta japonica]
MDCDAPDWGRPAARAARPAALAPAARLCPFGNLLGSKTTPLTLDFIKVYWAAEKGTSSVDVSKIQQNARLSGIDGGAGTPEIKYSASNPAPLLSPRRLDLFFSSARSAGQLVPSRSERGARPAHLVHDTEPRRPRGERLEGSREIFI